MSVRTAMLLVSLGVLAVLVYAGHRTRQWVEVHPPGGMLPGTQCWVLQNYIDSQSHARVECLEPPTQVSR